VVVLDLSGRKISQPIYGTGRLIIAMSAAQLAAIDPHEALNKPMSVLLDAVVLDLSGRKISQPTYGTGRLIIAMSAAQLAAIGPHEAPNKPIHVS